MSNRLFVVEFVVILATIIAATAGWLLFSGFGSNDEGPRTPVGDLQLDHVELGQNGETHVVPAGLFRDQIDDLVLNEGLASLTLTFKADEGEVEGREVKLIDRDDDAEQPTTLDEDGKAVFLLNLNLTLDGEAYRFNPYTLKIEDDNRDFELLVTRASGGGDVTDTPNTPSEITGEVDPDRPHTVEFEVDPNFVAAFARFCGFEVEDVVKVKLEKNDRERHQVAWTGSEFVQAHSTIAIGQPVWVAVSKSGDRCYINPPCGNPEVPEGKLPPAPPELRPPTSTPGKEVHSTPTRTNTPRPGSTPTPPATNTPVHKTATPTATVPPFTPTKVPPTQTPQATPTRPVCHCPTPVTPEPTFDFNDERPPDQESDPPHTVVPPSEPPPPRPTLPPAVPTNVTR